ncbi:MAG: mannose-1-phosphate guanylyltransferase/mannose-6-phosphate isomerase [Oceanospirillaceae bacterium]|nr:mannose-1-phosphate guanylyltransferase/mannose-6-phosphate isomerase [Oceanospirillaceae bacterium]MCP5334535.1 mannose-1-phosphate guanylyltransferase/mannose-6-phosphate isomerase [Oceanospirillaceae bacterium]
MKVIPVVMAGGSGTRLWPLSRGLYPKQFLPLLGEQTMLQQTCLRAREFTDEPPVLICNEEHRFIASEQIRLAGIVGAKLILEPVGKNTAPAIALAALSLCEAEDAIMVVLSADHYIHDPKIFASVVLRAADSAAEGGMVIFGVPPTNPETGYGYIQSGEGGGNGLYSVERFVEKPDKKTAEAYLADGSFLWNSGMFVFKASTYLSELGKFNPEILTACQAAMKCASHDLDFIRPGKEAFLMCPEDSIDYAVMEHTDDAKVIQLMAGWSDVGSWSSLWDVSAKDGQGNSSVGDVMFYGTENTYVHSKDKLTAVLGLSGVVVVDTKDALLVASKDKVQDIKAIVNQLKDGRRHLTDTHREVYRPWGIYDSIDSGERHQVKRITVKPQAKLSVQMHHHRAEHWIVVKGTAKVTINDITRLVAENESVYIPVGAIHALENPGKIPLELIEVQSGAYLGEDDIVRFEDRYGRA